MAAEGDLARLRIDRSGVTRQSKGGGGSGLIFSLVFLALCAGALWIFREPIMARIDGLRLPLVRVTRVSLSAPADAGAIAGLASNGYIVAARRAALSADTPGRIVELKVREGQLLEKDELVARLYDAEYAAAVQRCEADLNSARAQILRAEAARRAIDAEIEQLEAAVAAAEQAIRVDQADLDLAQRESVRTEDLVKKGAAMTRDLDQVRATLAATQARLARTRALRDGANKAVGSSRARIAVAEAEIAVARAGLEVATANLAQSRATLVKAEIRAPFKGVVVLKDAELGEVVSPNVQSGGSSRGSIVTMVDFGSLEVQAEVAETSIARVIIGAPVTVFLDAFPSIPYLGTVDRIWPTADRQKATIEVRVVFAEPDERLRPEMGARVVFARAPESPAQSSEPTKPEIILPEKVIVAESGGDAVFILERETLRLQPVTLGARKNGRVTVIAGLSEGQQVVVEPAPSLRDGARVQVAPR